MVITIIARMSAAHLAPIHGVMSMDVLVAIVHGSDRGEIFDITRRKITRAAKTTPMK